MKTVATPHPDVTTMQAKWPLVRALYAGTAAMRDADTQFLPREAAESLEAYRDRKNRTVLFNAFRKTVDDMAGRVFAKEIALGDDVPARLVPMLENVDMTGRHVNVFAADLFKDALQTGIAHVLVDTPVDAGETLANAARPYWVHLRAEDIIGWTHRTGQGALELETLRYYETVEEVDGVHVSRVKQVKVLLPGAYEVWRQKDGGGDWQMVASGPRGMAEIPLATVYLGRTGFMTAKPPLQDLADLNVTHWQSSSDQRNILHVARVPILFGAGFPEDAPLVIGSASLTRASDPAAKLAYVEHSGAAITSGRDDLKDLEYQMQAMGLQLLVSEPGQSATGEVRDDVKENSRLGMFAEALKDGLEMALYWTAKMAGAGEDGGSVTVNKDFGITARGQVEITALISAANAGLISKETAIREMIRRGFLADNIDPEKELLAANAEALAAIENEADTRDAFGTGGTP